jgi:acylphosphatase
MPTRSYHVSGRVQGVGFRWFTARAARRLGLSGFVRNLDDGRVEVLASGSDGALSELESTLRQGPPHAWVEAVQVVPPPTDARLGPGFVVR